VSKEVTELGALLYPVGNLYHQVGDVLLVHLHLQYSADLWYSMLHSLNADRYRLCSPNDGAL
jgi:hypothetical protein